MTSPGPQRREDRELLDAWAAGDRNAGNELVERYFDVVYRFVRQRSGGAASDLVQRTFLACVEHPERLADVVSFRAFVLGVARNLLLRDARRDGIRQRAAARGAGEFREELDASMGGQVARRAEQRLLMRALRKLPFDLQVTIELHYWEGLSAAEVADVLEIPRGTVLNRLFRARKALHSAIEELAETPALAHSTMRDLEALARSVQDLLQQLSNEDPKHPRRKRTS